jgi:hypothetical protein
MSRRFRIGDRVASSVPCALSGGEALGLIVEHGNQFEWLVVFDDYCCPYNGWVAVDGIELRLVE